MYVCACRLFFFHLLILERSNWNKFRMRINESFLNCFYFEVYWENETKHIVSQKKAVGALFFSGTLRLPNVHHISQVRSTFLQFNCLYLIIVDNCLCEMENIHQNTLFRCFIWFSKMNFLSSNWKHGADFRNNNTSRAHRMKLHFVVDYGGNWIKILRKRTDYIIHLTR